MLSIEQRKQAVQKHLDEQKYEYDKSWTNFGENQATNDVFHVVVRERAQLGELIRLVAANKLTIHAASGGPGWDYLKQTVEKKYRASYSRSGVARADVIVNLVGPEFEKIEMVDADKKIVSVGPNIQMKYFVNHIYKNYGLTVRMTTLMPFVSYIGADQICGIDTSPTDAPVSNQKVAFEICNFKGEYEWIVPGSDDDFDSLKHCMLGLFGIVTAIHVQCVDAFKLEYRSTLRSINDVMWDIRNGLFTNSSVDRISLFHTPAYGHKSYSFTEKSIMVMKWTPVATTVEDKDVPTEADALLQNIEVSATETLDMGGFEEKHSHLVPLVTKGIRASQFKEQHIIAPFPDIKFNIFAYPHKISNMDFIFRAKVKSNTLELAADFIFKTLEKYAKNDQYVLGYGMYIRCMGGVAKGSENSFAPTHHSEGELSYSIDLVSVNKIRGYDAFIAEVVDRLRKPDIATEFHLGKDIPAHITLPLMLGPRFYRALTVLVAFYANPKRNGNFLTSPFLTEDLRALCDFEKLDLEELNQPQPTFWSEETDDKLEEKKNADQRKRSSVTRGNDKESLSLLPTMTVISQSGANKASVANLNSRIEVLPDDHSKKEVKAKSKFSFPCHC